MNENDYNQPALEPGLAYPSNKFNPYDPNHVTLQLLQEVHSQRIQVQIDRDNERRLRRDEIAKHAELRHQREEERFAAMKKIDDLERERDAMKRVANKAIDALKVCAKYGRSHAQKYAAEQANRW